MNETASPGTSLIAIVFSQILLATSVAVLAIFVYMLVTDRISQNFLVAEALHASSVSINAHRISLWNLT